MHNLTDCDDVAITDKDLRLILLAKGITGTVSLVTVVFSLILVFLFVRFKKQYLKEITVTERLLLYVGFATIFRSVVAILQTTAVDFKDGDKLQEGVCDFTGFLDQWSIWVVLLSIQTLVLHVLIQLLNADLSHKRLLEVFYVIFPIFFPLLFSWIPFFLNDDAYGLAGGWCWIRRIPDHCTEGFIWQITFWFGPLVIFQILDVLALFAAYPALFRNKRKKNVFNEKDGWNLLKQHGPLLSLILLSIIVNWFSVGNRVYIAFSKRHNINVWYFHAIMASSWGMLAAIAIFLYVMSLVASQKSYLHGRKDTENSWAFLENTLYHHVNS